ncbi:MAG: hypothetical protein ACMUJM_02115 [bacterium]
MSFELPLTLINEANTWQHIQNSGYLIEKAMEMAAPERIAVLGCGRCREIPLPLLMRRCNRIYLVDTDLSALRDVESKFSCDPPRLEFFAEDLTGLIPYVEAKAPEITRESRNPEECLAALGELLLEAKPRFLAFPKKFDLVICSAMLSQLQAKIKRATLETFPQKFGPGYPGINTNKKWMKDLWNFARRLEHAFINHLDSLVNPGGVIYLSATVKVCWVKEEQEGKRYTTEGSWITLESGQLPNYLSVDHKIERTVNWPWARKEGENEYWGRLYEIQAVIYRV